MAPMAPTLMCIALALGMLCSVSASKVFDLHESPLDLVHEPLANEDNAALPPGKFSFYILAMSWQATFCHHHETQFPGCNDPHEFWRTHFTLHGLWPEQNAGPHPGNCSVEPFDAEALVDSIGLQELMTFWPNVKVDEEDEQHYPDFWKHEWQRHGTCSGLRQLDFFTSTLQLAQRDVDALTPQVIQQNVGKLVSTKQLVDAYGGPGQVVLQCANHNELSAVMTCWSKDKTNHPIRRQECSTQVLREGTCHGEEILVRAFGA